MTDRQVDNPRPDYVSPQISSLDENDVAAGLGPVLLSGTHRLEPVSSLGSSVKYSGSDPINLIRPTPDK